MARVDKIIAEYDLKLKAFNKDIAKIKKDLKGTEKQGKKSAANISKDFKSLNSTFATLGVTIGAAFAISTIVGFGKELNKLAIQGEAFRNRAKIVFGDSLKFVEEFAEKSAIALGFTKTEFIGAAAAIGDILIPLGLSRQAAAEMSTEALRLGTALKRFSGDQRTAAEISSIVARSLTGEVEGLKSLGIVVQQNTKEFRALVKEKLEDGAASESQAKALAIYDTVIRSATDATNSLAQSTDTLQASQEVAQATLRQVEEELAVKTIPLFIEWNKILLETATNLGDIVGGDGALQGYLGLLKQSGSAMLSVMLPGLQKTIAGLKDQKEGTKEAAESMKLLVAAVKAGTITIEQVEARLGNQPGMDKFIANLKAATKETEALVVVEKKKEKEKEKSDAKEKTRLELALKELEVLDRQEESTNELLVSLKKLNEEKAKETDIEAEQQLAAELNELSQLTFESESDRLIRLAALNEELNDKKAISDLQYQEYKRALSEETTRIEIDNMAKIFGATASLFNTLSSLAEENSKFQKFLAINEIILQEAQAIAAGNTLAMLSSNDWKEALAAGITITASIISTFAGILSQARKVKTPDAPSFEVGGYTGEGNKKDIAGEVHKKEYVQTASTTKKYRSELDAMHSGNFDSLIYQKYIKPEQDYARSVLQNLDLQAELNDTRLHKDLKTISKLSMINTNRLVGALKKEERR